MKTMTQKANGFERKKDVKKECEGSRFSFAFSFERNGVSHRLLSRYSPRQSLQTLRSISLVSYTLHGGFSEFSL
ncbi:hypothetical protein FZM91_15880 [Enterococcus faecium]|uniref:Uncharacterized protein n=1 Tax=Enterococcus faecium TaxID=1352 RepID=A0AB73TL86_ENTFC|nr:hypothetical protein HMPREF1374_01514 [Enterococcus faecium P1190]EJX72061.1 hypothetical protein HMPREF1372_02661 [Enterococcus faecium P1139]EJX79022.1 hypothetical protein HMPREF1370_02090 [Enterococcus faecium P1123]EJY48727.1 hypothetical protein HMPREF1346_02867 [Enterococcus faecium 503]KAB7565907.1 hypothetical protein GBM43_14615 [Enterococcus faecium]